MRYIIAITLIMAGTTACRNSSPSSSSNSTDRSVAATASAVVTAVEKRLSQSAAPSVDSIEIAGMGLTWTVERYTAKFASDGLRCRPSKYHVTHQMMPGYLTESKASLPITICTSRCKDRSGDDSRLVVLYDGAPFRVRFHPCAATPITLGVAASTYAAKVGHVVEVRARAFSHGVFRDLDGFQIDLDRGQIIADDGVPGYADADPNPINKPLNSIQWDDNDKIREMEAAIEQAELHGPARAAAKKVDL